MNANLEAARQVDAKKETIIGDDALSLVDGVKDLYVAKGKKVVHVNVKKEKPDADTLRQLLLGPTGNLRAPTLRKGQALIVGFDAEIYQKVLG